MSVTRLGGRQAVLPVLVALACALAACSSESSDPEGAAMQACWTAALDTVSADSQASATLKSVRSSGEGATRRITAEIAAGDAVRTFKCTASRSGADKSFTLTAIEESTP